MTPTRSTVPSTPHPRANLKVQPFLPKSSTQTDVELLAEASLAVPVYELSGQPIPVDPEIVAGIFNVRAR